MKATARQVQQTHWWNIEDVRDERECLDRLLFGKRHLDYLISEYVDDHNTTRSSKVRELVYQMKGTRSTMLSLSTER